jgi:hypothetical protein
MLYSIRYLNQLKIFKAMKKGFIAAFIFLALVLLFLSACQPNKAADECASLEKNKDDCYYNKSLSTANDDLCHNIKNELLQRACLAEVAIINLDLELCNSINSSYCVSTIAENKLDADICRSIKDRNWHDICIKRIAFNTSNSTLLKEMSSDDDRDDAYSEIAKKLNDIKLCYFILDSADRDICIGRQAIKDKNSNECYDIRDIVVKSVCYLRIAELTQKISICDNIQLTNLRDDCRNSVQGIIDKGIDKGVK